MEAVVNGETKAMIAHGKGPKACLAWNPERTLRCWRLLGHKGPHRDTVMVPQVIEWPRKKGDRPR